MYKFNRRGGRSKNHTKKLPIILLKIRGHVQINRRGGPKIVLYDGPVPLITSSRVNSVNLDFSLRLWDWEVLREKWRIRCTSMSSCDLGTGMSLVRVTIVGLKEKLISVSLSEESAAKKIRGKPTFVVFSWWSKLEPALFAMPFHRNHHSFVIHWPAAACCFFRENRGSSAECPVYFFIFFLSGLPWFNIQIFQ